MCFSDAMSFVTDHVPETLPFIREMLGSESARQRELGAEAVPLGRSEYDEAFAPVLAEAWFAHRDAFRFRAFLFRAFEWNRSPKLLPVWLDVLDEPLAGRVSVAAERLADIGPPAAGSIDRLAEIATTHWDASARLAAARAHNRLVSGEKRIGPTLDRCPRLVRHPEAPDARWVVRLAQGDVELRDLTVPTWTPVEHRTLGRYGSWSGQALAVGRDLVFAYSGIECTGGIEVWRDGKGVAVGGGETVLLERRGDDVLVFQSCGGWGLDLLTRGPDEEWAQRPLASGAGSPMAFGVETDGAVDLLVLEHRTWAWPTDPCESPQEAHVPYELRERGPFLLLRIDRDGSVTVRD